MDVLRRAALVVTALCTIAHADPEVVLVGTHEMLLKDDVTPPISTGARKFTFNVRSGSAPPANQVAMPAPGSAGDPTPAGSTGGGGVLELYNTSGTGEVVAIPLPATSWRLAGNASSGFRYIYASSGPIWKIWIKGTKISIRGGKALWAYTIDEPAQASIGLRLTLGSGITWCTEALPRLGGDRPGRFQAERMQDAPGTCPALP